MGVGVRTGIDIVSISRIARAVGRPGFLSRICTGAEVALGANLSSPYPLYARLFAAKEAAAKALGTGIGRGFAFTDIEVFFERGADGFGPHGHACLRFLNGAAVKLGNRRAFLSCSTSVDLAVAYVLIE